MLPHLTCLLVALLHISRCGLATANVSNRAKPIIIDTDVMTDVDDVGALAIANVLHNCGVCDLQAVMVNTNSRYGALAISVINTYFGNDPIPIAALRPLTDDIFLDRRTYVLSDFASKIAHNFPRALGSAEETPIPLELYRSTLAAAENDSITIISIGFLTNLAELLDSPGGSHLVASKVKELVVMGGRYPSGWEWNFGGHDAKSTKRVIESWPKSVPMTFSGYELGKPILSGQHLRDHAPADSPVLAAYEWYSGRCSTTRESWDPLTVLYGIIGRGDVPSTGLQSPFQFANTHGCNSITTANGSNAWVDDEKVTNQHWLKLADGVSNSSLSELLTSLFAHDPSDRGCSAKAPPKVAMAEDQVRSIFMADAMW